MENETNLFVLERYNKIIDYLKDKGRATVNELSDYLFVSPATIRRDLSAMQKLGMLKRTHGGAIYVEAGSEVSMYVRMESDGEEKGKAAEAALSHLPEFTSVFIDNSSTCLVLAERMDLSFKTVVTNGLQLASKLANKKNVNVILLGGSLTHNSGATNGGITISQLNAFRFDLMLMGAAAVSKDGSYERSIETADTKMAAFQRSDKRILVIGGGKFALKAPYRVADLSAFDAICTDAPSSVIAPLKEAGIKIFNR